MLSARPGPRTSMCTLAALCDRNTAACPAELPPPDDGDLLAAAQLRLEVGRAVDDARALEARAAREAPACGSARRWR